MESLVSPSGLGPSLSSSLPKSGLFLGLGPGEDWYELPASLLLVFCLVASFRSSTSLCRLRVWFFFVCSLSFCVIWFYLFWYRILCSVGVASYRYSSLSVVSLLTLLSDSDFSVFFPSPLLKILIKPHKVSVGPGTEDSRDLSLSQRAV